MLQYFSRIPLADKLKLLHIKFEVYTLHTDQGITLQSHKKWSKSDRNNVSFLPVTATLVIIIVLTCTYMRDMPRSLLCTHVPSKVYMYIISICPIA